MFTEIEETLKELEYYSKELAKKESQLEKYDADLICLEHKRDLILQSKEYYKKAIDIFYDSSIKELMELVNDIMSFVFYDQNYTIRMEIADNRSKAILWYLRDESKNVEMPIKKGLGNGVGRGIKAVLSFMLQAYFALTCGTNYLFIDEGYTFISEEYVDKFFELVIAYCLEKNLGLVLITHDDRFKAYGFNSYKVVKGVATQAC